jgi:hypothetical protein
MGWLASLRQWCCRTLKCSGGASKENILLQHFMFQLHDEFVAALSPSGEERVLNDEIVGRLRDLFAQEGTPTWERAYRIERLLVFIRPRSKLLIEVERRVSEAEGLKLPSAPKYRAQLNAIDADEKAAIGTAEEAARARANAAPGTDVSQLDAVAAQAQGRANAAKAQADNQRRAILSAVLDDLQWFYQQRILKRKALWDSARNLVAFGFATLLFVGFPFLVFLFAKITGRTSIVEVIRHFPNFGLFTAVSFGLLGAFFSRLISLQFASEMTVEDAENRYGLASLFIRASVGMFGALIMYFLLGTELLGQTVKPDFAQLGFKPGSVVTMLSKDSVEVLLPSASWCLLIIWSFLAGFSERLVPDSLARAEGQVSGTQKQP